MNMAAIDKAAGVQDMAHGAGEYLSFRLGSEEYGIDILKVQEIRGYEAATRMVNAPVHTLGVLNLRGVIVPVLDLRIAFGMEKVVYDHQTVTIVLNIANRVVGVVVDSVSDVIAIKAEDIKHAPDLGGNSSSADVIGIATIEQGESHRLLILLDIEKLISRDEMGSMLNTTQQIRKENTQ